MSSTEGNPEDGGNAAGLQPEACCAPGCHCSSGSSGGGAHRTIGIVILAAAGVLVARAVIKSNGAKAEPVASDFASVTTLTDAAAPSDGSESAAGTGNMAATAAGATRGAESEVVATIAGKKIAALSELNQVAAETDAVFVYLPGQKEDADKVAPTSPLDGAVRTISAQGYSVGVFTLKSSAPEYTQLAGQMAVPGVVAIVKGRGMAPVTGDITETKLIQGFVAASSAGGGCGPSGCGPKGCN